MKKTLMTLALATTAVSVTQGQELQTSTDRSAADYLENRFGAGLMLGEPTGLSLKYWLNESFAIDGGVGGSFRHDNGLQLHSDVLWHAFSLFDTSHGRLAPYLGVGLRGKFEDGSDRAGVRFPIGITYMFESHPIDVFFEVAPIMDFTPDVDGDFNIAAGARFWF